jgi:hypothetical protein
MEKKERTPRNGKLYVRFFVLTMAALVALLGTVAAVASVAGRTAPASISGVGGAGMAAVSVHGIVIPGGGNSPTPTRCPIPPGCLTASPTPTCPPGVVCDTPTATPTCHPGQCDTPTATPTSCGAGGCSTPTSTPCGPPPAGCATDTPTATPTCPVGAQCASPTPTNCGPEGCASVTPTATPTCPPGVLCGTATPTRTPTRTRTPTPTPTLPCVPTPDGMTHWYPLDETSGSIANEIIFGGNAFEINGPAHVPGKVAGGLNFNGVNQWAGVFPPSNSPQLGTGDFTIDTWISIPTSSLVGTQVFLDGRNFAPRGYAMFLFNGKLALQLGDLLPPPNGYSNYIAPTQGGLANPGWHFVAATVRRIPNGGTLWVDGVPLLTFTPRLGNLSNNAPLWIGRHHPNAYANLTSYFRGSLDEIEFFRRALTPTEVLSIYNAGAGGKCKPTPVPPTATPTPGPCPWCSTDVPVGSTFYLHVTNLVYQGVVTGYPCGGPNEPCVPPGNYNYYRPGNNVTRGQISKLVALSAGFNDTPTGQSFEDVPPGQTFYVWIGQLSSRSLINGYPCGGLGERCVPPGNLPYFRPFNNATRGQLAKIVANAAGITDDPGAQIFEDVPPGQTFYNYINPLARRGVINGYPCGSLGEPCNPPGNLPYYRPGNNVTRGQAAKIVANTFWLDDWLEP